MVSSKSVPVEASLHSRFNRRFRTARPLPNPCAVLGSPDPMAIDHGSTRPLQTARESDGCTPPNRMGRRGVTPPGDLTCHQDLHPLV